jgi:hypothetical protein
MKKTAPPDRFGGELFRGKTVFRRFIAEQIHPERPVFKGSPPFLYK